ncbi:unnamed protein product [Pipistrellus nathusii]|uniref:Uncharacterized protein n=1 Tax=Pipistrellus nathusii TaxID=59473 RepID=A0ABN9Z990_PIPNA
MCLFKGGLGHRFRGLAWDKLPLPAAPLVASLVETLRVQETKLRRHTSEGRKASVCSRERPHWLAQGFLTCFLKGILAEVSGSQWEFSFSAVCFNMLINQSFSGQYYLQRMSPKRDLDSMGSAPKWSGMCKPFVPKCPWLGKRRPCHLLSC